MPNLTGFTEVFQGDTSATASVREVPLGTRGRDTDGNEYIYLQGVASGNFRDAVVFDEAHATIRTVADSQGRLAVAMGTALANEFGWYQIYGRAQVNTGTVADEGDVYLTSTDGSLDDADVAGDAVVGAKFRSANSNGSAIIELNYPFCHDVAID